MVKQKDKRLDLLKDEKDDALPAYYQTSTGRMVRHLIARKLTPVLKASYPHARHDVAVAALGYMRPYLKYIANHYPHVINLQTIAGPARSWPPAGSAHKGNSYRSRQAIVDPAALPLLDASLDGLFIMHGLERAPAPHAVMAEAWRTLKSNASMVVVVPHRGSIWASRDDTPFGTGVPYSINQIKSLLTDHDFAVGKIHQSLVAPPSNSTFYPRYAPFVERLPNPFGGVLIVEARKMIYAIKGKTVMDHAKLHRRAQARAVAPSRPVIRHDRTR